MPILLQILKKHRVCSSFPEDITQTGGAGCTLQFDARANGNFQQGFGGSSEGAAGVFFKLDRSHCFEKLDDRPAGLAQVHFLSPHNWVTVGYQQAAKSAPAR